MIWINVTKHNNIKNLISAIRNSHSQMINIFTKGSCINFYIILKQVYPEAIAYYNVDHIITKIDRYYYDINGRVLNTKGYLPFTSYYDEKGTSRAFTQMYNAEFKLTQE